MVKHPTNVNKQIALLDVQKLTLELNGKCLLSDLYLTLSENEILALVGESGSGKSLLALSLLGLQPQNASLTAQRLLFDGHPLLELESPLWQSLRGNKIGMVFQEPQSSLNPSMRCGKQLQEVLQQHTTLSKKEQHLKIKEALTEVQLPDPERIFKSYPHEISGGQKTTGNDCYGITLPSQSFDR